MADESQLIDGLKAPRFLYGTAWKEDATQPLTELALQQGFRGIDTANQRRHYHEAAVGKAIAAAIERGHVTRAELFLQTKFTFRSGQDHRLPYDEHATVSTQVAQSFVSSLDHLGTDFIDSYVLHGPASRKGLIPADWDAWKAMEEIHDDGRARLLGVSNVSLEQIELLCAGARVQPRFVQNRCFATTAWDRSIRQFCDAHEIVYQGFSLLTANRELLSHSQLAQIAQRHERTASQIIFRFAIEVGTIPLTGTTSAEHMRADLEVSNFELEPADVAQIERMGVR